MLRDFRSIFFGDGLRSVLTGDLDLRLTLDLSSDLLLSRLRLSDLDLRLLRGEGELRRRFGETRFSLLTFFLGVGLRDRRFGVRLLDFRFGVRDRLSRFLLFTVIFRLSDGFTISS